MANFSYKALDGNGKSCKGIVEAASKAAAISKLRSRGLVPFEIQQTRSSAAGSSQNTAPAENQPFWQRRITFGRKVPKTAVAGMARQLSTLLQAGLPLDQALTAIGTNGSVQAMDLIVIEIRDAILSGKDLADAMANYPKVFSSTFVAMIRAGEASGTLEIVMERLAAHLEQQVELRRKIKATLAYPVLMLVVGLCVVIFLLSYVIPQVTKIFADMGKDLPLPTQILLSLSDGLRAWWWLMLLLGIAFALGIWRLGKSAAGKRFIQNKITGLPFVRGIYAPILLATMTRTLGMLLKNGVSLLKALVIVKSASDNIDLRASLEQMVEGVQAGKDLSQYMEDTRFYPPLARQMVAAGEKSGRLEEMLLWVASDCESKVAAQLQMLTALLEPVLILLLGTMVGFVVIAIILPIFEMSTLAG